MDEPLDRSVAKRLLRKILEHGKVAFSNHALREMAKDDLDTVDCTNVLRGGVVGSTELERNSWRYRVSTQRICVVVAFRSETELVVVTAWRTAK